MCENKLQCIICSDIHMSHNDNSRNVSHIFLIDHNLTGPGRSHAQAAKQHLLLISRPPARWATGFSGDLQHNYLLLYIMFCFCNVCTVVLEINILLLLLRSQYFINRSCCLRNNGNCPVSPNIARSELLWRTHKTSLRYFSWIRSRFTTGFSWNQISRAYSIMGRTCWLNILKCSDVCSSFPTALWTHVLVVIMARVPFSAK